MGDPDSWRMEKLRGDEWQVMEVETSMGDCESNCSWAGICSLTGDGGKMSIDEHSTKQCRCMQVEVRDEACADEPLCMNGCRGHGRCDDNMCLCDSGYWCEGCHGDRIALPARPALSCRAVPCAARP